MRGVAALYVVVYHVYRALTHYHLLSYPLAFAISWASAGRSAVAVFIVLSGYCLMLPVSRTADMQLAGGWRTFLQRRAWRILPPYYAALALSLLALTPFLHLLNNVAVYGADALPAFEPGVLLSHAFLVHNLSADWIYTIDGPMWSVATECQIYILFVCVLLPLARRFGTIAAVPAGFLIGAFLHSALRINYAASFWFIALFAMGMLAAEITHGTRASARLLRINWSRCSVLIFALFVLSFIVEDRLPIEIGPTVYTVWLDLLVGTGAMFFIIASAKQEHGADAPGNRLAQQVIGTIKRALESPMLVALGAFSYSLYLIHWPIIAVLDAILYRASATAFTHSLLLLASVPLCVLMAYGFHVVFERPFMRRRVRSATWDVAHPVVTGISQNAAPGGGSL